MKTLIEKKTNHHLALAFGRKHQSAQTGFVHDRDAISLYENFCFALALFRSHVADHIIEGRELLMKLFPFQNEEGGFPFFLHQYPQVFAPRTNVAILFPHYLIWKNYRHVLGKDIVQALEASIENISAFVDTLTLPPVSAYQRAAFNSVYKGREKPVLPQGLTTSEELSQVALGAQLLGESLQVPWHSTLNQFAGTHANEFQWEYSPKVTGLDFLLRQVELAEDRMMLKAALYYPMEIHTYFPKDHSYQEEEFFLTYLKKFSPNEKLQKPGLHLLRLFFGQHSLVCQETTMEFESDGKGEFFFTYPNEESIPMELKFFLNSLPKIDIHVHEKKATLFSLGDPITFERFTLTFEIEEGEGDICGHIHKGNRPAQVCPAVKKNFEAYDWQIGLRTLRRTSHFVIKASLSWADSERLS